MVGALVLDPFSASGNRELRLLQGSLWCFDGGRVKIDQIVWICALSLLVNHFRLESEYMVSRELSFAEKQ